jgi:hypothetical protein
MPKKVQHADLGPGDYGRDGQGGTQGDGEDGPQGYGRYPSKKRARAKPSANLPMIPTEFPLKKW